MFRLCALLCFTVATVSFGKPSSYIVLFQQAEIGVNSLGHEGFSTLLKNSNQKDVQQLKEWVGTRTKGNARVGTDLWLVRGATLQLTEGDAKRLAREPWVKGVYPDRQRKMVHPSPKTKVGATLSEADTGPSTLWGLNQIGLAKIKAEYPHLTGRGVRVGVLDTGIQSRHPELTSAKVKFKDFVNGLPGAYDDQGHGTHVSGTIAGKQTGIAPEVELVVAKVFTATGGGVDSEILAAMQWMFDPDGNPATDDYPRIVSNSWGADLTGAGILDLAAFAPYHQAIRTWVYGGMIPIFAAGNSGAVPNGFPGGFPEAIAVGAFGSTGEIAEFSSRGPNLWRIDQAVLTFMKPDVSAPGVDIASAIPGNQYASMAGTSMATPHVAGAAALALQANPKLRLDTLKALLLQTSVKKVDNQFGYGLLDAHALVQAASTRALQ